MSASVSVPFKKYFFGKSENGITFHWLQCTYEEQVEDAIANSVWILYRPSMLADAPETWSEVMPAIHQCRTFFEKIMSLTSASPELSRQAPKRVNITFAKIFNPALEIGKTFDWLSRTYEHRSIDLIVHAVRLVYYPAALAAAEGNDSSALKQVRRSRIVFENRMLEAIAQIKPDQKGLITNQLDQTFFAPSHERPKTIQPKAHDSKAELDKSAAEPSADDSLDDSGKDLDDQLKSYDALAGLDESSIEQTIADSLDDFDEQPQSHDSLKGLDKNAAEPSADDSLDDSGEDFDDLDYDSNPTH